jgi:hypothetical protein
LRTVPPIPREPSARTLEPRCPRELLADVLAQRLEVLGLDALGREKALCRDDRAEPPGTGVLRQAAGDRT